MSRRTLMSLLAGGALLAGLAVGVSPLLHAADVRGEGKGQGKVGDLCKQNTDCEQTPRPLTCRETNGELRCAAPIIRPPT